MEEYSDEKLVAASGGGDKNAYAKLVERHYKQVFLFCLGIVGNVQDAEDIVQESILKGFTEISKLRDGSQFGSWLAKISRNLSVNALRRKQRGRHILKAKTMQHNIETGTNENLQQAIEQLPMEIRLPLVMYYFDGQSVQKVADKLNISTSAVYAKLRTAINELHGLLAGQGDKNG